MVTREHVGPELLETVREGVMPDVMKKSRIRNEPRLFPQLLLDSPTFPEAAERGHRQVIHTHRMVESGVGRTGIDEVRESELLDVPLPLEVRGIDDANRCGVEPNRVPERIADDPLFTVERHARTLAEAA